MKTPDLPNNEADRLAALDRYKALNTKMEQAFDDLTILAAHLCAAPISLISLVDERRQWFKSKVGISATETAREISFCGHAILQSDLFIVPDATKDERFSDNPLVTGEPQICFYAGAPLLTPDGHAIGTLCVIDHVSRQLNPTQRDALLVLSRQVMAQLDLRRQTHELVDSERRLRIVTENSRVGLAIVNYPRRYVYANTAYAEIIGRSLSEIVGQQVGAVLGVLYEEKIRPRLDLAFDGKRTAYELTKKVDGLDRYYAVRYEPVREANAEQLVVVAITDITVSKLAELVSAQLAAIVESSDDAIIGKDLNCIITSWNRGAAEIFGYSSNEMLGTSIMRLIPANRQHEEEHILRKIRNGERIDHFETVRQTKDGRLINVSVTASPIKDAAGKIVGASKVARDISERKRTEARFRRLVDSNVQGVMLWKATGEITGANDAFLRMVGYSREALEANRVMWSSMTPPEYAEVDQRSREEIAAKGVCMPYEKEFIRQDGARVPVLIGMAAFEDSPDEGVCFVLDLTERKKLEQQFLRAQRMESIGTLAGGIAHDLNNVLAPIVMSIELLKEMVREEGVTYLTLLQASALRGAALVKQVLSFARGVEGQRISIDLAHVMRDLVAVIQDTFPKPIHLNFVPERNLWTITGDPTQMHQVFMNLCVNARDAMPNGGTLSVSMENVVLDETYAAMTLDSRPGSYVMVKFADTGAGIPTEIQDRVFEPFFTTKEIGKGTGLGLSTTLAIIKSHRGFIHLYSEVGKGTQFKIYLPADPNTVAADESAAEQTQLPRGNGELILVVDDEEILRITAKRTLENFGYRVLLARNGAEAVALYAQHKSGVAVVLTDMAMPVMDGLTTIVALKEINPAVKIIASSGLALNENVAKARGAGIQNFVHKPYSASALLKVLKEVLGKA